MRVVVHASALTVALVLSPLGGSTPAEAGFLKFLKSAAEPLPMPDPDPAFSGPAMGAPMMGGMPTPGPAVSYNTTCTAASCIKYRDAIFDFCKAPNNPCCPPVQCVLCVTNPCTCCPISVPVCLPNSCCDQPTMSCHKGLLGSQTVTYKWCCGVTVKVRFDKCGDVVVTTRGA